MAKYIKILLFAIVSQGRQTGQPTTSTRLLVLVWWFPRMLCEETHSRSTWVWCLTETGVHSLLFHLLNSTKTKTVSSPDLHDRLQTLSFKVKNLYIVSVNMNMMYAVLIHNRFHLCGFKSSNMKTLVLHFIKIMC